MAKVERKHSAAAMFLEEFLSPTGLVDGFTPKQWARVGEARNKRRVLYQVAGVWVGIQKCRACKKNFLTPPRPGRWTTLCPDDTADYAKRSTAWRRSHRKQLLGMRKRGQQVREGKVMNRAKSLKEKLAAGPLSESAAARERRNARDRANRVKLKESGIKKAKSKTEAAA